MNIRILKYLLFSLILLAAVSTAKSKAENPRIHVNDYCKTVIRLIKAKNYEKIEKLNMSMDTIFEQTYEICNLDLKDEYYESLKQKNDSVILNVVKYLLFCDIQYHFIKIKNTDITQANQKMKSILKEALEDYVIFAELGETRPNFFENNRTVIKLFQRAYGVLQVKTPYRDAVQKIDFTVFDAITENIIQTCIDILPEIEREKIAISPAGSS